MKIPSFYEIFRLILGIVVFSVLFSVRLQSLLRKSLRRMGREGCLLAFFSKLNYSKAQNV